MSLGKKNSVKKVRNQYGSLTRGKNHPQLIKKGYQGVSSCTDLFVQNRLD